MEGALVLGKRPEDIHVLLVDDERVSRLVVGNLLRKCNYQVTVATSGLEALDILRKHAKETFHLILTDVMMPDVDGIELLKHIRSDEAFNSMPVVMMSANEHTETVFECIRRGAEDYLLKPVTKKEVQYICQHVWRRQKQVPARIPFLDSDEGVQDREDAMADNLPDFQPERFQAIISAQMVDHDALIRQNDTLGMPSEEIQDPPLNAQFISNNHTPPPGLSILATPENRQRRDEESRCSQLNSHPEEQNNILRRREQRRPHLHHISNNRSPGGGGSASGRHGFLAECQALRGIQFPTVAHKVKVPISVYFEKRGQTVSSVDSFKIFSAAASLIQAHHARGETVKVRPSRLCITDSGNLVMCDSSGRQAEFENKLYASPEELLSKPLSMASDLYSLGVLFFELFHPVATGKERFHILSGLRHRQLPLTLLSDRPQEAEFVLSLLHPDPLSRPSVAKIMQPSCLLALQTSISSAMASQKDSEPLDFSALLEFLQKMQTKKASEAQTLQSHLDIIDDDIRQVNIRLRALSAKDASRHLNAEASSDSNGSVSSQGKRDRDWIEASKPAEASSLGRKSFDEAVVSGEQLGLRAKWKRIWDEHPVLENLYMRQYQAQKTLQRIGAAPNTSKDCSEENHHELAVRDRLSDLSQDLTMLAKNHRFEVKATLKYGDLMGEGDMVCAAAFDRDDEYFATAGVCKRIKIFETAGVMVENTLHHYPVLEVPVNSKISSLCWNSYVKMCMLAADYDGGIQLWDVSTNSLTAQFEEHLKRVWSVDFSQTDPTRFVSGSDDGTVKLWSMRDNGPVATIDSKANVCSVQLSPHNSNLLAFGSANNRAYLYDLRKMATPLTMIEGHKKAVSYVRFLGPNRLVSASTDNKLKLWDIDAAISGQGPSSLVNTFSGHTNQRNFVGLSVSSSGYIACGSESNDVYVYYHTIPSPLTKHSFANKSQPLESKAEGRQFVSTVCWSHKGSSLLAANSAGVIKVLDLKT